MRNSNVLIRRLPNETKTEGGILLSENQRYENILCEILDLGPGKLKEDGTREDMSILKVGDIVIIDQQSDRPIDGELRYVDVSEIFAIYEE